MVVQGKNVVSLEPPYMEGQFVVVKDAKRTYDAEVLYAGTFVFKEWACLAYFDFFVICFVDWGRGC